MTGGSVVKQLLGGLFDYTGMFPPAGLDLEAALRCTAAFPRSLGRPYLVGSEAVLPADRLDALTPDLLDACGFGPGDLLRIVALGPPDLCLAPGVSGRNFRYAATDGSRGEAQSDTGRVLQRLVSYEIRMAARPWQLAGLREGLRDRPGEALLLAARHTQVREVGGPPDRPQGAGFVRIEDR